MAKTAMRRARIALQRNALAAVGMGGAHSAVEA